MLGFHNKMKHGSMIYFDEKKDNELFFLNVKKDGSIDYFGRTRVDLKQAKKYVEEIESLCVKLQQLIDFILITVEYKLDELNLSKNEKEELKKSLSESNI